MEFEPKTEEEIIEEMLWPEGDYAFEILSGTDKVSKKGNQMIELNLQIFNNEGQFIFVYDYLLESMKFKLLHISEACGLYDKYMTGKLTGDDFKGKTGMLKLGRQDAQNGYAAKNAVDDYIKGDKEAKPAKKQSTKADLEEKLDDDLPF